MQSKDRLLAYGAFCRLRASPADALALLKDHLRPAKAVPAERLAELIKNLDSNSFDIRQEAEQELKKNGLAAEKALRQAASNKPSLEAARRIDKLLADLDTSADWEGTLTALKLLEELPSVPAREFLEGLGKGDADFQLTREARTMLHRMGKRD